MFESWLAVALSWALAAIFVNATDHKLTEHRRFAASLAAYKVVPTSLVPAVAVCVVVLELLAVASLITVSQVGAAIAALLLVGYGAAIALNLIRGRHHIDCGCGDDPTPISWWAVSRNAILAVAALWLCTTPVAVAPVGLWQVTFCIATAGLLFGIYRCTEELLTNLGIYRRLWLGADH